jgi:hypothetical protein
VDFVASRNLVACLAVVWWLVGPVHAQSDAPPLPAPVEQGTEEIPPELQLPEELPFESGVFDGAPLIGDDGGAELLDGMDLLVEEGPARLESSGTWLRRGFWYVEQDVVILNRDYLRDTTLAVDTSNAKVNFFVSPPRPVFPSKRRLFVDSAQPDASVAARLTLGRFLFRDEKNRDNSAEFTFLGLGHWAFRDSVTPVLPDRLMTPLGAHADAVTYIVETGGYNLSNFQAFALKTKFDSYEGNYRVRWRHHKDQMVLGPDGQWTRKMSPSGFHSFLFGGRYLYMHEGFDWQSRADDAVINDPTDPNGQPIFRPAATGDMHIGTRNDLVGCQIGGDWIRQWPRWSLGVRGKVGPFINFTKQKTDLVIDDPLLGDTQRFVEATDETFAMVGEAGVFAHYNIHPNLTLRIAFEMLFLSSVANAIEQVEFQQAALPHVRTGGTQQYLGASFGFDYYW